HYHINSILPVTAPPKPSSLSLHDALPIFGVERDHFALLGHHQRVDLDDARVGRLIRFVRPEGELHEAVDGVAGKSEPERQIARLDRKSTRLNSSHGSISYAVFCLNKQTVY